MENDDFVSETLHGLADWQEWGQRLTSLMSEVRDKIGEAPIVFRADGEVFMHPELAQTLQEPGNEGPLEYLQYLKRIAVPTHE